MNPAAPAVLTLRVVQAYTPVPDIRVFALQSPRGEPLPGYTAGAHIRVRVELGDSGEHWRHYSLVNLLPQLDATEAPTEYVIAVRREADGRGGSRYMHEHVQEGDELTVEAPRNEFSLRDVPGCAVLVAGGIGVTPLATMAARRRAQGAPVRMHYAGRQRAGMAFVAPLQALLGEDLRLHVDDEVGAPLDLARLLDGCSPLESLYVCGPKPMLDATLAATQARGRAAQRVHFELFAQPGAQPGDQPFEIELAQSGRRLPVRADQTILDCLIDHGCDPLFDCKRGECGVCAAPVLQGQIDHRDYVLTQRERTEGRVIQTCVSRAAGARLVLDI